MFVVRRFMSSVAQTGKYGLFLRPRGSPSELELRYLQCTCCWRCRIPVAGFETLNATLSSPVTPSKDEDKHQDKPLDAYYTLEQRATILLMLNNASENEMSSVKLLRGRKSHSIIEYRTQNGPFKDLESVVNVPLLKHKSAVTVFNNILKPPKIRVKAQLAKFIRPEVDKSWLSKADTIVSIVCGTNSIAWAHVNKGMTLLDWQEVECPNFMKGAYMASAYLEDISSVVSRLPSPTFYVVEKSSLSLQNTTLFPVVAHMRTVEAMLFSLLEPRYTNPNPQDMPPRVLNMMRAAVGRHFGLIVGESRTSGAQEVRQMMTDSVTQSEPRLRFPQDLLVKHRNSFHMGLKNGGDEMCDALLQAVAFYEMLRNKDSS